MNCPIEFVQLLSDLGWEFSMTGELWVNKVGVHAPWRKAVEIELLAHIASKKELERTEGYARG